MGNLSIIELTLDFTREELSNFFGAEKYLNDYELLLLKFGSVYSDRFDMYYKYRIRKEKKQYYGDKNTR